MHRTRKPVRKCHGCPLNLGPRCAVYEYPHDQWHDRDKCPGYMNEAMLRQYEARVAKAKSDHGRLERRAAMKSAETEPHWTGKRAPGRQSA